VTDDHLNGTQDCADGFWGECAASDPATCATGYTLCTDEHCREDCGENCDPASQKEVACEYTGHFNGHQICSEDGTAWSECQKDDPVTCFEGYTLCTDGVCETDCGECSPKATQACVTEDHFKGTQTCGADRKWGECTAGQQCAEGYEKCPDDTCLVECPVTENRADINKDGKINVQDLSRLLSNWGSDPQDPTADLNDDGKVGILDLSILLSNWSK